MQTICLKPFYGICLFLACWCAACGKSDIRPGGGAAIVMEEGFVSCKVNEAILYTTGYEELTAAEVARLPPGIFRKHGSGSVLSLGSTLHNHHAWLRLDLVNRAREQGRFTLLTDHGRCDRLELFSLTPEGAVLLGEIDRTTPMSDRYYPCNDFALPVSLAPGDSLQLLMRTTRRAGVAELNAWIYEERAFYLHEYRTALWNTFTIAFAAAVTLLALFIGVMYRQKLMMALGGFAACFLGLFSYMLNYWDGIEFPAFTGLKNHNLGGFLTFIAHTVFHFYGNELLRNYGIRKEWYRRVSSGLQMVTAVMAFLLLLPVDIDRLYVYSFWILTILNVGCFIYIALLLYREARVKWVIWIVLLAVAPTLADIPRRLYHNESGDFFFGLKLFNEGVITVLLVYFTLRQLLYELASRAQVDQFIIQTRTDMDEIRKEEVQKIGRNLHDQVGNTLATLLGYLNAGKNEPGKVRMLVEEAIREIRFMSHNLVKDDELPLGEKISNMVDRFNEFSDISFLYSDYSGGRLEKLSHVGQQNIYLIIQEAFTNAIRHSGAKEVTVQVFENGDGLQVSIEDDGKGFNMATATRGLGLKNMRKRADLTRMKLLIDASPGNGVSIIIESAHEN